MRMHNWQFSVRTLLLLTAVASLVLAVAVHIPEVIVLSLILGLSWLLVIEGPWEILRLLFSERHPWWSAAAWIVLGTLLLAATAALGWRLASSRVTSEPWKIGLVAALYGGLAATSYRAAIRSVRRARTQDSPPTGR